MKPQPTILSQCINILAQELSSITKKAEDAENLLKEGFSSFVKSSKYDAKSLSMSISKVLATGDEQKLTELLKTTKEYKNLSTYSSLDSHANILLLHTCAAASNYIRYYFFQKVLEESGIKRSETILNLCIEFMDEMLRDPSHISTMKSIAEKIYPDLTYSYEPPYELIKLVIDSKKHTN